MRQQKSKSSTVGRNAVDDPSSVNKLMQKLGGIKSSSGLIRMTTFPMYYSQSRKVKYCDVAELLNIIFILYICDWDVQNIVAVEKSTR